MRFSVFLAKETPQVFTGEDEKVMIYVGNEAPRCDAAGS